MADIALLVVEELERGSKRAAMLRRGSPEPASGDGYSYGGGRPASASGTREPGACAAASAGRVCVAGPELAGAMGLAAADGFFSA